MQVRMARRLRRSQRMSSVNTRGFQVLIRYRAALLLTNVSHLLSTSAVGVTFDLLRTSPGGPIKCRADRQHQGRL
jgi:hypothetical protein